MQRFLIFSLFVLSVPAFAAFNATTQWNVRTDGADTNGGAFDPGVVSPGTDASQAASGTAITVTLATGTTGTCSITCTSTTNGPGNFIHIASGSGCTTGWFEILSQSSGTITIDHSMGSASDACVGVLGGALLTVSQANSNIVTGNTVNIMSNGAGSYSIGSGITNSVEATFIGYHATYKDGGTKPLLTTSGTNALFGTNVNGTIFNNIAFSSTNVSPGVAFAQPNSTDYSVWVNCKFSGFSIAIDGRNGGGFYFAAGSTISGSEFTSNTTAISNADGVTMVNNYIHGNTGDAITQANGGANDAWVLIGNIIVSNNRGFVISVGSTNKNVILGNSIASQTSDGIAFTNSTPTLVLYQNNILYGNGGYGINLTSGQPVEVNAYNAYGSNTTAPRNNIGAGANDVAITAGPFTNSGSGDYSLNNAVGGGAALRAAGYPGLFPGGTTTGYAPIGAVVPQAGGGSGGQHGYPIIQ